MRVRRSHRDQKTPTCTGHAAGLLLAGFIGSSDFGMLLKCPRRSKSTNSDQPHFWPVSLAPPIESKRRPAGCGASYEVPLGPTDAHVHGACGWPMLVRFYWTFGLLHAVKVSSEARKSEKAPMDVFRSPLHFRGSQSIRQTPFHTRHIPRLLWKAENPQVRKFENCP